MHNNNTYKILLKLLFISSQVLVILSCTLAIQAKPQYGGMGQFGGGQFGSNYGMGGEGGYQGGGYGAQGMQGGHDSAHHTSSITSVSTSL